MQICGLGPMGNLTLLPKHVIIVDVDESGNIIGSLQNTDERVMTLLILLLLPTKGTVLSYHFLLP